MIDPNLKIATGFYTIWDIFGELNEGVSNWLRNQEKKKPKTELLNTVDEAAYTFNQAFESGGREYLVTEGLQAKLKNIFKINEMRLGGNGYHMGRAIYDLGVIPLVSYPCRPKSIMAASPNFKVACKDGLKTPEQAIVEDDPVYEHLIIEFNKDDQKGIHVSGRQIFSYDLMSFQGKFDEHFLSYGFNRNYVDILIFAYAHLLLPKYKERTDVVVDSLSTSKRPKVHFEFGDGSDESVFYAMKKFSDAQCSNSWGFNEKECRKYLGAKSENLDDLKNATLYTAKKYGLERICVHTPDLVFSVSKYNFKKEMEALQKGVQTATALTMGSITKKLSEAAKLPKSKIESKIEKMEGEYNFCLIPTYINMKPIILTGLGDTFAAVQAAVILGR